MSLLAAVGRLSWVIRQAMRWVLSIGRGGGKLEGWRRTMRCSGGKRPTLFPFLRFFLFASMPWVSGFSWLRKRLCV